MPGISKPGGDVPARASIPHASIPQHERIGRYFDRILTTLICGSMRLLFLVGHLATPKRGLLRSGRTVGRRFESSFVVRCRITSGHGITVSRQSAMSRKFQPMRSIAIETINDADAARSPYAGALQSSFDVSVDFRSLVLYRKHADTRRT